MKRPASFHPNPQQLALGIQQPWAELILRGIKTLEVRSSDTRVRGLIYLYTSKRLSSLPAASLAAVQHHIELEALPRGLLVGTVELVASRPAIAVDAVASCVPEELLTNRFCWEFTNPVRLEAPQPVRFLPYGVWFYPFQRKSQGK